MKFFFLFNFLISIILLLNINFILSKNIEKSSDSKINQNIKTHKKDKLLKKRKIMDYYFIGKMKSKHKNINEELTQDFNNYQRINDKKAKIFPKIKYIKLKNNFNNDFLKEEYNIHSKLIENSIINEDNKRNNFLIKYYNKKNRQEEEINKESTTQNDNLNLVKKGNKNIINNNNPVRNNFRHYIPNERNIIYNDYNNFHYNPSDEEFDYGMHDYKNGRNFHHEEYNMRYNSRSSSYQNSHQTFSNNQPQKSKLTEYMNSIYQIMMAFFFVGLVYKLFFGNKQNDKYALAWYEANKDYFKERYKIFGLVEDEENGSFKKDDNMKDCIMIKENPNNYKLICGNYRYIKYIAVSLQFHKRYDMSLMVASIFVSLKDKIIFQVTFNSVDPCGWVFCIGKKNQCKAIKDNYEDLNYFCEIYQPNFMDEYLCLISEDYDIFVELFKNKNLLQYYKDIEPFIETIYYSDIINLLTDENNIYFSFDIDLSCSYQNRIFLKITHFVNLFVDGLAQIKYTKEFREKVNNNRILYRETKINDSRKKEMEEIEKKNFIEKWKIKNKMKGKSGFERKKLEKKLKKYH